MRGLERTIDEALPNVEAWKPLPGAEDVLLSAVEKLATEMGNRESIESL